MKKHWTKNKKMIREAINQDEHPVSLLALELTRVERLSWNDAEKKAKRLIESCR
jgi:hypothetical protein